MMTQTFKIHGMHCTSCAMRIDMDLEDVPGVKEARTNFARSVTQVTYDPARASVDQLVAAIAAAGYTAQPAQ